MNTTQAIYIVWEEETAEFDHWVYGGAGSGEVFPVFTQTTITKRCRFSSEVTDEMFARAEQWIQAERPDAKVIVIDED